MEPPFVNISLSAHPASHNAAGTTLAQEVGTLAEFLVQNKGWSWASTENDSDNHVIHNPSYTGCQQAGHIWVDSVDFAETGCYDTPDLGVLYKRWTGIDLDFYRIYGTCTKKKQ
jgi:hypothetical protein